MEQCQDCYLMFNILEFVLIERQQRLFANRQRLWHGRDLGTLEEVFDLPSGKAESQVHLNGLHPFDGFLVEVAIAVLQATSAQQLFLIVVTQGAHTYSGTAG